MERSCLEHFFLSALDGQAAATFAWVPPAIDHFSLGHLFCFLSWLSGNDLLQFE
jgi:hypothetical protein